MFGHFGVPSRKTPGIIRSLALLNKERGKDSTGIIAVSEKSFILHKNIVDSDVFFRYPETQKILKDFRQLDFGIFMGHTRRATRGAVTQPNSHPFVQDDVIFTHNGIISNFDTLQTEYKTDYEVDSQIIGKLLNDKKVSGLDELSGNFTVPYILKSEPDVLRVAVHNQVFGYAFKGNQLYYSSTIEHLRNALQNKSSFTYVEVPRWDDLLYSFYLVGDHITVAREAITPKKYYDAKKWDRDWDDRWDYGGVGGCWKGNKCKNKEEHRNILPAETQWSTTHKLFTSEECNIGQYCLYKKDHKRMDALEREYEDEELKDLITRRLYREKYAKRKTFTNALTKLELFTKEEITSLTKPMFSTK